MAAPDAEKRWAANSETPAPGDTAHAEPLADEPLERVGTEKDLEEGKIVDKEEAIEEIESQDGDEKWKSGRLQVQRTQSTKTATSIATSDAGETQELPPRKRTWGERLNPLKSKNPKPVPSHRIPSREYGAGFFSLLTFQWIAPLMSVGYQRPLEVNDVWAVNPDREVDKMSEKLLAALKRRQDASDKRPLTMALYDTFKKEFWIGAMCALTSAIVQIMSPFTMKYLIYFAGEAYEAQVRGLPAPKIARGIGLVIGITCMQVIQSLCTNHFIYRGMMVGGEARSVLISVIFDKAMRLSGRARAGGNHKSATAKDEEAPQNLKAGSKEEKAFFKKKLGKERQKKSDDTAGWSNGRIVNLMSTDTYRIDQGFGMFHICWTSPIQVILALALLLINLTYSALAGFGFVCIMMPLLGKAISSLMYEPIRFEPRTG